MFWKRKKKEAETYDLFVEDNYHYGDEEHKPVKRRTYITYEEAVREAKRIVDDYLEVAYQSPMTAKELPNGYKIYGEDPFVVPDTGKGRFSAWDYAEVRCREICGEEQ